MDMFRCFHIQIALALLLFIQNSSTEASDHAKNTSGCIATERSALAGFKAHLSDPANRLSSWKGGDCCQWKGVRCSNRTGHVVKLDLRGPDCDNSGWSTQVLGGTISSLLLGLQHLQYVDLSCNSFNESHIPEFLGSLHNLRHLDLSQLSFFGSIPPQLGNLSNLRYLNLHSTYSHTYSTDITWLSRLSSLEHLDMTSVDLSSNLDWLSVVNMIPSLRVLCLPSCSLSNSTNSLTYSNLTSLETLDISGNWFQTRITPNWFWDLTSLKNLYIYRNDFYGPFPHEIGNMTSIEDLDLSENNLVGMIPSNMKNLCNLERFVTYFNNLNGSITEFFQRLPSCSWNKLQILSVNYSNLRGSLPTMLEPLSNLSWLDLRGNMLTGPVPLWIGELTKLTDLDLSLNNLDGVIHEGHLSGLLSLKSLSLADNSIAIKVNSTWVPPFTLTEVDLRSCILGPKFPTWLRWQTSVRILDISNTSISDMVPDWFWTTASSVMYLSIRNNQIRGGLPSKLEFMRALEMDLSSNQFTGPIPKLPVNLTSLDLSSNKLFGPLPLDFGAPGIRTLLLFDNSISGAIPSSLCKLQSLQVLDLSSNKLCGPLPLDFGAPGIYTLLLFDNSISGAIPSSLCKLLLLQVLDLSGNRLTGSIPDCLDNESTTNMTSLSILNLSLGNNNLSGVFPSFLQYCQQLIFLDLTHNQFFGSLPAWIGEKLPYLKFLRLRSNMFYGPIPVELTKLVNLQYLDLAYNNISGSIPKSFVNCTGMTLLGDNKHHNSHQGVCLLRPCPVTYIYDTENITIVTKGQERLYSREIIYMVNLDLSCNNLVGEIPEEIGSLVALKNLNLSWNAISGKIPKKIGALVQVESLDLSHNELSGEIPTSLSALTSLIRLNLSYNNLTGKIPTGNQLQTLDDKASIYIGNPGLCGPPLSKNCSETEFIPEEHEDGSDLAFFLLAMGSGYVVGLWIVFCIFLFKRKWRAASFSFYDRSYDWVYVQVAVSWASLTRKNE